MRKTWQSAVVAMLAGAVGLCAGLVMAKTSYPPVEVLVSGTRTVIGEDIRYPEGTAKITAAIVTMQPGEATGWHKHNAPLFAWVLDGEVTVDYGDRGIRTYRKGDAFLEAFQSHHNGANTHDDVTRILAVFAGAADVDNTEMR